MKPVVFLGPTLSVDDARRELDADYRPPVEMGDVWRVARFQPPAIGLIDGYFHSVPSVWHKEILWAIQEGIAVFGAASMGALRAAELDAFGMIGVGEIYQAYRRGDLEDDDDVALVHADGSLNYRALSEPMVNIRSTLDRAVAEGIVGPMTQKSLLDIAKAQFYPRRTWSQLLHLADDTGLPGTECDALRAWLPAHRVDRKREDALQMMQAMRRYLDSREECFVSEHLPFHRRDQDLDVNVSATPKRGGGARSESLEVTSLWQALIDQEQAKDDTLVLEELKLEPELYREAQQIVASLSGSQLAWRHVLEELARRSEYDRLLAQAYRKHALEQQGRLDTALGNRLPPDDLLRWFFEIRLGGWPEDIHVFLRERGWTHEEDVLAIAQREYQACQELRGG